jgi:hypothetical protein
MKLTGFKAIKKVNVGIFETFVGGIQVRHGTHPLYYVWSDIHRLNKKDAITDAHSVAFNNDLTLIG